MQGQEPALVKHEQPLQPGYDCAAVVADLDVLMPMVPGHVMPPARTLIRPLIRSLEVTVMASGEQAESGPAGPHI